MQDVTRRASARAAQKAVASVSRRLRAFAGQEDGVSSMEWIVIAAGATALGLMLFQTGQEELTVYSGEVRDEIQSPYFNTDWVDHLPLQQD